MTATIDAFGLTDLGKKRQSNQDNFLVVEVSRTVGVTQSSLPLESIGTLPRGMAGSLFVVADGVGGGPGGERASGETVAAVLKYVGETVRCFDSESVSNEHALFERLEEMVEGVHASLRAGLAPDAKAPATTLTMVFLVWPRAYHVHVGDSRAYVRRGDKLQQLTRDQTFADYMTNIGAWTEEQATRSLAGATLTSAIGGSEMRPVVGLIDLEPGDSLLLCSDGLTKHVPDERLAEVLSSSGDAESMCHTLIEEALTAGGTDNITVIVANSH